MAKRCGSVAVPHRVSEVLLVERTTITDLDARLKA